MEKEEDMPQAHEHEYPQEENWDQCQWAPGNYHIGHQGSWGYSGPNWFGSGFCGIIVGEDDKEEEDNKGQSNAAHLDIDRFYS